MIDKCGKCLQIPLINSTQRIVIYETKTRFYVVSSNSIESQFRVMKIDRTEPKHLVVSDDKVTYNKKEIRDLLSMIENGNRPKVLQKGLMGLSKTVSSFGIVGFVRFLQGYYMVLITKRRRVGVIGYHTIFKIEDTTMIYIPNDDVNISNPEEQRYLKMFQNIDLSSNFYFSYSYDLSNSLQYNLQPCHCQHIGQTSSCSNCSDNPKDIVYGMKWMPSDKYCWNNYLLDPVKSLIHWDWMLYVIHGFVGQSNINVFGRPIFLTLIARRSRQFAGTRFLKRGSNTEGHVANEVETEQIVHDASTNLQARFTSYVQIRGSVPLHWSQDIVKMVPKPAITLDQHDPFGYTAGQHFNTVLKRFGSPIIILNLVKKREKKPHESILGEEFYQVCSFLNQFLRPDHKINYIHFDMARVSKSKTSNVLLKLAEIAESCMKKTGFYRNFLVSSEKLKNNPTQGMRQHGVVRTNCVDCLDRTNTAQFALGKCALAHQLYSLGVIARPSIEFDSDCVRMLEELYEDQGDTLALQYGGSQLVHRIKGYRKMAPWTSSSRDIMQTLSRYYSNAFSDADKQNALNIFLGTFSPTEGQSNIWELPTDTYLHSAHCSRTKPAIIRSCSQWWDVEMLNCLPFSLEEESKGQNNLLCCLKLESGDERVDGYGEFYRPFQITSLDQNYICNMFSSIRNFMPKFSNDVSPFIPRITPSRRREESAEITSKSVNTLTNSISKIAVSFSNGATIKSLTESNPNVSGKNSSSSMTSNNSDSSSDNDCDSQVETDTPTVNHEQFVLKTDETPSKFVSLKDLFPTMSKTYGVCIQEPTKHSLSLYKRHVQIGINSSRCDVDTRNESKRLRAGTLLIQKSVYPLDNSYGVIPPKVSNSSINLYTKHVNCGKIGPSKPSKKNLSLYKQYVQQAL